MSARTAPGPLGPAAMLADSLLVITDADGSLIVGFPDNVRPGPGRGWACTVWFGDQCREVADTNADGNYLIERENWPRSCGVVAGQRFDNFDALYKALQDAR